MLYKGYTEAEEKQLIREEIAKEKEHQADLDRNKRLRAEVEVEDAWEFWASEPEHRNNFKRWFHEWADGNVQTYLDKMVRYEIPSYHVQRDANPDDYEPYFNARYSLYKYRSLKDKEMDRQTTIRCWIYTGGGIGIIIGLLILLSQAL